MRIQGAQGASSLSVCFFILQIIYNAYIFCKLQFQVILWSKILLSSLHQPIFHQLSTNFFINIKKNLPQQKFLRPSRNNINKPQKQKKPNHKMYSSCPTILKHFIPLKFSQQAVDHKPGPSLFAPIRKQPPFLETPFTNMKLQCLKNNTKDFVLVFKNESCRQYSARKKVRYGALWREMRRGQGDFGGDAEKQEGDGLKQDGEQGVASQNQNHFMRTQCIGYRSQAKMKINTFGFRSTGTSQPITESRPKPRNICSMDSFRNHKLKLQFRRTNTSKQPKRITFSSKNSSPRQIQHNNQEQISKMYKTVKQNSQNPTISSISKSKKYKQQQQSTQEIKNLIQFKIRGSRAPKSETTDFFKQIKLDINYNLAQKLIK